MATFVFVAGAYAGGWIWREVATRLRTAGHEVFTPTLTGLGERVHLARPEVDLDTHVQDVLGVLRYEDLHDVVLVGHGIGGIVISAVAERAPERLAQLVYLDAVVLEDGECFADLWLREEPSPMPIVEAMVRAKGDGWRVPVSEDEDPRMTPQPLKPMQQRLALGNPAAAALPRTFVYCTDRTDMARFDAITPSAERARAKGWRYRELPAPHMAIRTAPDLVARALLEIL